MMEINKNLKAMPYGVGNFHDLRCEDFFYCDKTKYIELLEKFHIDYPLIVRPRRFGKTLFTNTLFDYYDSARASSFDDTFKGTYIYDHKTASASSNVTDIPNLKQVVAVFGGFELKECVVL